jgi:uncharacterized membrane protein
MAAAVYLSSLLGLVVVGLAIQQMPLETMDSITCRRAIASSIRTAGCVAWPALLFYLVPCEDHGRGVMIVPLLWMMLMWMLDMKLLYTSESNGLGIPASLRFEPNMLTGLTFGLCGLVGARPDGNYTHLFLYAVVGCLLIVTPSHNLKDDSIDEMIFESIQKIVLFWCLGLLLTGVVLSSRPSPTCNEP